MRMFDQAAVAQALPYPVLVEALAQGLKTPIESPLRTHFEPNHDDSTVLIMPAWRPQQQAGVKLVSFWPGNGAKGLSTIAGIYVLLSCTDGQPLAVMDGTELTLRRTAAAAALAARHLARPDSRSLAILGTGSLAVPMALAHASVLPLERVRVWGRDTHKAASAAAAMRAHGLQAEAMTDLPALLAASDVVCAATAAAQPFIRTEWIRPGTHLGLVGAFTPRMAEAEPSLMARAEVYADLRAAVLEKGGEVFQAIAQGHIQASDIRAELADLAAPGRDPWRTQADTITVYKSVGFAALDLIAAEQVWRSVG